MIYCQSLFVIMIFMIIYDFIMIFKVYLFRALYRFICIKHDLYICSLDMKLLKFLFQGGCPVWTVIL